ncbi:MAG: T9SS type A sorting domain-containing protein [Candidatus Cloacimonetes bacterium]|nr:T9SS type A sorting domain-containing protein [Candidatus Cloacimonadota bacterium]
MKRMSLILLLLLLICSDVFALTGFGESNIFDINENTLPVELSLFNATIVNNNQIRIVWATQSETNILGYNIYRSFDYDDISDALLITDLIQSTNTSYSQLYEFIDNTIQLSGVYHYWLVCLELDGTENAHGPLAVHITVDEEWEAPGAPLSTGIKSIYPNPFNPSTTVVYQLKHPASVSIEVFNARGQLVSSMSRPEWKEGKYSWVFTGQDQYGKTLSSGIYQIVLTAAQQKSVRKIVLLK